MTRSCIQLETVKLFQLFDSAKGIGLKRTFPIEGVQDDAFQQISQSHVMEFSKSLENLE